MKEIKTYCVVGIAFLGLLLGGCSKSAEIPNVTGEMADAYAELGRSLEDARANLEEAETKLVAVGVALDSLEGNDLDLRTQYEALNGSINDMQLATENLKLNRGEVNQASGAVLEGWQEGLAGISNKKMREKSADRLNNATKSQKEFDEAIQTGASAMEAYFVTLKDLSKYLELELSKGSVKSASKTFKSVRKSEEEIKHWIEEILREITEMENDFSA